MRNIARTLTACCAMATIPALSLADDAAPAAAPTGPGLTDVLAASGITAHGYVDAGYTYDSGLGTYRQFDTQHNGFDLHQAGLTIAYQPTEGWGGLVNVIAGHDANVINEGTVGGGSGSFDVTQAFVQYAGGNWTVIGGRYVTLVGAEVINPTANTNTSRSLVFYTEPLTHTGIRATYAVDSTLSFIFGVTNGWDEVTASNSQKTIEAGVAYTPSKTFSLTAQGYFGTAPAFTGGKEGSRALIDAVVTWSATDALTLVFNPYYGSQENSLLPTESYGTGKWDGAAAYVNYAIDDQWRVSLRGEYVDDKDGIRTFVPQKLKEETLTFGYAPTKAVEIRMELRSDQSDKSTFLKPDAAVGSSQFSASLEGIVKF